MAKRLFLCDYCERPAPADDAGDFHCCGFTNHVHQPEELAPCPACPDGNVWTIGGPTGKVCPVCKGHAVVKRNGAPLGATEAA